MDVSGLEPDQLETLAAVGKRLRRAREERGWSVEQAANASLLRVQYIKSLENADFAALPEPVYVRGFFKKYGDLIGLNGTALATQFTKATTHLETETPLPVAQTLSDRPSDNFLLRPEHLLLFFLPFAIVVVVFANVLGNKNSPLARFQGGDAGRPFATIDDWTYIEGVFPESYVAPPTAVAPTPAPAPAIPQPIDTKPIQVGVRISEQPSWMSVMADGRIIFEGTLEPGTLQGWSAYGALSVKAGNAGAVRLFINSEDAGTMGAFGEVRQRLVQ